MRVWKTMEEDAVLFIKYLDRELNFSENTIISYKRDLEKFAQYLKRKQLNYKTITREEIRNYLKKLADENLKNSSISRNISCLRSFYNYLVLEGKMENNLFKTVSNPKQEKKLPNFLSYEELRKIIDSIDITTPLGIRDRLIIEIFYASGCRLSELINIKLQDINREQKTIRIMGKGRKERTVYYGEYAAEILDLYLSKARSKLINNKDIAYLFLSKKGEQITIAEMEIIIRDIVKNLSLKTHVTPHTFRHTFATHLLNNGADIKTVQELLGHANLNTTGIYTHVTNERLKEVYLHAFPRREKD